MDLSVCLMDKMNNNKYEVLYDGIKTMDEAMLLAQFVMCGKRDAELVFIFPGWNMSINKYHPDKFLEAIVLAEKYKSER